MNLKKSAPIYFLVFIATIASNSLLWAETPGQVVVQTIDNGLKILNDPSLQNFNMVAERRQKLWEAVKAVFSFEETAKRSLGRHWNNRSAEEKREFTKTFKNILKNLYLEKSDTYAQETIVYISETVKGNRSKVHTNIITSDGKEVGVDFSMKYLNNEWKIYDVIVEGVSIVGNYRSQFNSILSKSSFAELMEKLKEKEKKIKDN